MRTWQRVAAYAVAVVAVFAAAVGIGRAVGPVDTASDDEHGHDDARVHLEPAESGHEHGAAEEAGTDDYRLDLERDVLDAGRPRVAFRIVDGAGEPVTAYDVEHEKQLHLIAVRRDLAEFRHVHPRLDPATGRWSVPIPVTAGVWRLYADFVPSGADPTVAEADLMVAGDFTPEEIGADATTSRVDGYQVHLVRDATTSTISLHVTRDGQDVTDLQPYLGAYGHLVAIRADDLAYLHVHPEDGGPGPEVAFHAEFAEEGRYRLFLDFKHGGRVHTADFTITVDESSGDRAGEAGEMDEMDDEGGGHEH